MMALDSASLSPPAGSAPIPLDGAAVEALVSGRHGDPFAVLGCHGSELRCLAPGAEGVDFNVSRIHFERWGSPVVIFVTSDGSSLSCRQYDLCG